MGNHLKALALLYARPFRAISLILDLGRPVVAAVLAVIAGLAIYFGAYSRWLSAQVEVLNVPNPEEFQIPAHPSVTPLIFSLILLAAIFVPIAVIVMNKLEGTGSAAVVLPRDYMPVLVCHLMAYTAALLPIAIVAWAAPAIQGIVAIPALLYFAILSVCIVRTVAGTSFGRAVATTLAAFVVSAAGAYVYSFVAGALYFLASPFVLFYLYILFGQNLRSELSGFGGGLSSRQRMRQLLEIATVNPRDADARYQLGLIYQQRREFTRARECFEQAIAIDPREPDAQYQLGRVLRSTNRLPEALEHLKAAAAIDSKTSQSEVLRETGATLLDLGRDAEAREVLQVFTDRRGFDPEGWYWLGLAYARLGDSKAAREALEQSIESVRTAPAHLRRQVSRWQSMASKQLRQLP